MREGSRMLTIGHTKVVLLLIFSCSLPGLGLAQSIEFNFHHLTEADGIPRSTNYSFTHDAKGVLWIGTDDGLMKFSGQNIHHFRHIEGDSLSLPENRITSKGFPVGVEQLWFSAMGSLICYRRFTNDFVSFRVNDTEQDYEAFYQGKDQRIWLRIGRGNSGALWIFDPASEKFTSSIGLRGKSCQVVEDHQGNPAYIIQTEMPEKPGLEIINLLSGVIKTVEYPRTSEGVERTESTPTRGLFVESDGTTWTGGYNGLGRYSLIGNSLQGIFEMRRKKSVVADFHFVTDLVPLNEGYFLVSSDKGLLLFDRKERMFVRHFVHEDGFPGSLPFSEITSMFLEREAGLWLAGRQGEIAFSQPDKIRFENLLETKGHSVTTMRMGTDSDVWYSTSEHQSGVFSQENKQFDPVTHFTYSLMPDSQITLPPIDLFWGEGSSSWWGKVGNQFMNWQEESQRFFFLDGNYFGVPNSTEDAIQCFLRRSDGRYLFSLGRKLYRPILTDQRIDTLPWLSLAHLNPAPIIFLAEDAEKHIFIGDESGRLLILSEQQDQVVLLADLPNLGTIHALNQDTTQNTLYLATSKGLAQLSPKTFELTWLTEQDDNLPQETYYNAIPDEFGQLWLPGNNGLVRYHPDTKAFHRFTTADGLLSNVFTRNASLRVPETGEIWLGGKNGVNVFHPKDIKLSEFKPNISISELLVNDNPFEPKREENKGNINEKESLTFNYQDNTLSFRFVALDYSNPEANEYFYQMEGYDDKRVEAGTRNFVRYPNLPAGKYTFKIWATNSDKVLNEIPKILSLVIIPPIYQRWWFYLLCLLVISGILYAIFQYRLEQALKVERLRVKISSDLHDDVGGMLSGLAMQTELLELTANEERKPKLARVAEMSRSAMSRMRDTVWAIDARKDTLADLVDRMREHAEETLPPRSIQYAININRLETDRVLATDVRQSLYLIYKEAITNAAKHSNGDTVNVDLRSDEAGFTMQLHDNGTVPAKDYKTTGAGLSNMQMRAASIDATLTVNTDNGYRIVLWRKSL